MNETLSNKEIKDIRKLGENLLGKKFPSGKEGDEVHDRPKINVNLRDLDVGCKILREVKPKAVFNMPVIYDFDVSMVNAVNVREFIDTLNPDDFEFL